MLAAIFFGHRPAQFHITPCTLNLAWSVQLCRQSSGQKVNADIVVDTSSFTYQSMADIYMYVHIMISCQFFNNYISNNDTLV